MSYACNGANSACNCIDKCCELRTNQHMPRKQRTWAMIRLRNNNGGTYREALLQKGRQWRDARSRRRQMAHKGTAMPLWGRGRQRFVRTEGERVDIFSWTRTGLTTLSRGVRGVRRGLTTEWVMVCYDLQARRLARGGRGLNQCQKS